jgi:hypothetical protein
MAPTTHLPSSLGGDPPQQWLAAPSPVYLTGEEFLRLSSIGSASGVTLTLSGRVLRPDNTIERIVLQHQPNANRTVASSDSSLPEGWLLGLTVRASAGTPSSGQVWVNLELGIGLTGAKQIVQSLGCGFCVTNVPYAWPGGVSNQPLDGTGILRSITGTTPAAGAEISETVPTGARWQVLAFRYQLVTSATVASRLSALLFDDGANILAFFGGDATEAAGATFVYSFAAGFSPIVGSATNAIGRGLPGAVFLPAGARIKTQTSAIQVGDQYSIVQYLVREWMTGE